MGIYKHTIINILIKIPFKAPNFRIVFSDIYMVLTKTNCGISKGIYMLLVGWKYGFCTGISWVFNAIVTGLVPVNGCC
jgi:hypothetical protein